MSMRNKTIIMSILLLLAPFAIVAIWLSPLLEPRFPRPAVRHGEFPFRLVYEIHGEEIIVEGTVIARFNGISGSAWIGGRQRSWRAYHLVNENSTNVSQGNRNMYLPLDDTNAIYLFLGFASYYMGDRNPRESIMGDHHPNVSFFSIRAPRVVQFIEPRGSQRLTEDELLENYGIRIISWEPSPPIENRFSRFRW